MFFNTIEQQANGYFKVKITNNDKNGCIINKKGEVKAKNSKKRATFLPYEYIQRRNDGFFSVLKNCSWGLIDKNHNELVPPLYDVIGNYDNSYFVVQKYSFKEIKSGHNLDNIKIVKYGLINLKGELVLPFDYDYLQSIGNEKAVFHNFPQDSEYNHNKSANLPKGLIDIKNKSIIQDQIYNEINEYMHDMSLYNIEGKYGYFNKNEDIAFNTLFDYATSFNKNGLAIVSLNGRYGLINEKGEKILPFNYASLSGLTNSNTIIVKENNLFGLINADGENIIKPKYVNLRRLQDDIFEATINGVAGCINNHDTVIVPFGYRGIYVTDGFLVAMIVDSEKNYERLVYFDMNGNKIKEEESEYYDSNYYIDTTLEYDDCNERNVCGSCGESPCRCSDPF